MSEQPRFLRMAGLALLAAGVISAVGVAFLVAMFVAFAVGVRSAGLGFGWINDVLVLVSYLLAAPGVIAVHTVLRRRSPRLSVFVAALGLAAIAGIVVLQALLILGVLTFEEQIGPASIAFVGLGAWFVLTGHLGASDGTPPGGVRIGLLAALYVGFPIWAVRSGRRFIQRAGEPGRIQAPAPAIQ